jgi:hypothetical protein
MRISSVISMVFNRKKDLSEELAKKDDEVKVLQLQLSHLQNRKEKVVLGEASSIELFTFTEPLYYFSNLHRSTIEYRDYYFLTVDDAFESTFRKDLAVNKIKLLKIGSNYFRCIDSELVEITLGSPNTRKDKRSL